MEYISLIYLCKHHYLFYLYKSKDLFSRYNRLLPIRLFFVWFHWRDIIALVWSNPSSISNWASIESCFICKNKIWLVLNPSYFFWTKSIRFFFNRPLRYIVKTFDFSYLKFWETKYLRIASLPILTPFLQIFCLTTQRLKDHYLFQDISLLFRKLTCL